MTPELRALGQWSLCCTMIARKSPARLSAPQIALFAAAALCDRAGKPVTMTDLKGLLGDLAGRSVRTSYTVFLEPTPERPEGLNWLVRQPSPLDGRENFIRLTPRGRRVVDGLVRIMDAL